MTNELSSSHLLNTLESLTNNENHLTSSMRSCFHSDLPKVSSSSQPPVSLGDNSTYLSSNFQDPLFSQPSQHVHLNHEQGFERGDRNQSIIELKFNPNDKMLTHQKVIRLVKCKTERMKISPKRSINRSHSITTKKSKIQRQRKTIDRRGKKSITSQKTKLRRIDRKKPIGLTRSSRKYHLVNASVNPRRLTIRSKSKKRVKTDRNRHSQKTMSRYSVTSVNSKVDVSKGNKKKREVSSLDTFPTPVLRRHSSRLRRQSKSTIIKKQSKTNLKNGHECSKSNVRSRQRSQSSKSLPSQMRKKRKCSFPRCTSKTLITIAPSTIHRAQTVDAKRLKSCSNIVAHEPTSPPLSLTKNGPQLNSKNNNNRYRSIGRRVRENSSKKSMAKGMRLRSRTIMIKTKE